MGWEDDNSFDSNDNGNSGGGKTHGDGDKKKEFPKTALSEGKLALRGYKTDEMDYPPKLQVEVVRNQVHITIWTSVKGDERRPITCRYSSIMFFQLLQLMHDIEDMPNDTILSIDNKVRDKESKQKVLDTKFVIGKDKEGNYFISGTAKGCTKVQFRYGYEEFHSLYINGEPMTKPQASLVQFRAYRNLMHGLMPVILANNYDPAPKGDWKGKGGGGNSNKGGNKNYNNKGGGGGGKDFGSRDNSYDDDTSF